MGNYLFGRSDLAGLDQFRKEFKRAIKGRFRLRGESAGRELPHPQMILNALAAKPFARARLVGTIAVGPVVYFLAFHTFLLSLVAYPFILGELGRIGQGNLWETAPFTTNLAEKR
jgi:hypothetical protein